MIPQVIDVSPNGLAAFTVGATLDGVTLRFRFRWLPFIGLWTMTVVGHSMPLVVRSGGRVLINPSVVPGQLVWLGPDPYTREDLGDRLRLVYVPNA